MIAPGPLIPAHAKIDANCFACHAPFAGVSAERCIACHKLADIGVRTTKNAAILKGGSTIAFHASLIESNCTACHTDHSGPQLVKAARHSFAHDLLRPDIRNKCAACHRAPANTLNRQAGSNCAQCHTQAAWKPATFDHRRFFTLAGPHDASCTTCHTAGDLTRYTCFVCHEHQPAQMRAGHAEEGIRNIENCVRCDRNGSGEGREGGNEGGDDD